MDARFIRAPFRRVLVSRPRHHAIGLLIVDVLISLHLARSNGVRLAFLRGEQGEDSPMLHLAAEGVSVMDNPVVGSRTVSRAWTLILKAIRFKEGLFAPRVPLVNASLWVTDLGLTWLVLAISRVHLVRRSWNSWIGAMQIRLDSIPASEPSGAASVALWMCRVLERVKVPMLIRTADGRERAMRARARLGVQLQEVRRGIPPSRQVHHGFDLRRMCVEEPLRVGFSPADEDSARRVAERLGLADRPLVALHVRDGGSKRDTETGGFVRDIARDAQIATYLPAIDFLVSRGYTVARIGDAAMTPVERPGLVDVATHPDGSLLLDLWCVKHSRFFIACDSGPYMLSWLFNVPCLAVNITNVLGVFPLRAGDLYLIKLIQEVATGREIPLSEMLTTDFLAPLRRRMAKEGALRYLDNDEADILAGVREMEEGLRSPNLETPLQRTYRQQIEEIRNGPLVRAKLTEKTGSGEVLMGEGRVVHAFAERHFSTGRSGEAPQ